MTGTKKRPTWSSKNPKIAKVIVTKECITEGKAPEIVLRKPKRTVPAKTAGEAV